MRSRVSWWSVLAVVAVMAPCAVAQGPTRDSSANASTPSDTSGTGLMEWSYDQWSVPWVQVLGAVHALAPASNATLMVLECESADLERDRLARHLSAEECEHRMAGIRADQDTSLSFRLDLRVIDFAGVSGLTRLGPGTSVWLEDDRGQAWYPIATLRGPVLDVVRGERLRRVYDSYAPPWVRDTRVGHPYRYEPYGGRAITIAEHRARFERRDRRSMNPVISRSTRWLRLHLTYGSYEWVATWAFRPDSEVLR